MINSAITKIVNLCAHFRLTVIILGIAVMAGAAIFDVARFSINTDVERLISQALPWHQRQVALSHAFPQKGITAVVSAPTAENAERATNELAKALRDNPAFFRRWLSPIAAHSSTAMDCCWRRVQTSIKPPTGS